MTAPPLSHCLLRGGDGSTSGHGGGTRRLVCPHCGEWYRLVWAESELGAKPGKASCQPCNLGTAIQERASDLRKAVWVPL